MIGARRSSGKVTQSRTAYLSNRSEEFGAFKAQDLRPALCSLSCLSIAVNANQRLPRSTFLALEWNVADEAVGGDPGDAATASKECP
jgi:hypothetical protein